jgi:hypothetical protein
MSGRLNRQKLDLFLLQGAAERCDAAINGPSTIAVEALQAVGDDIERSPLGRRNISIRR